MEPATIAAQLREIAIYFDLDGDRRRAMAYEKAARSIEATSGLSLLIHEGRLEELPAIGPSIARVIGELARTGSSSVLEVQRAKWPAVIVELAHLPYVGVTKARQLHDALAPIDLDQVAAACRDHRVRDVPGFGEISERKVLAAIEERRLHGVRALHVDAEERALAIAAHLRGEPTVQRVEIAGDVRRWIEIAEQLGFAVATSSPDAVLARLREFPLVAAAELAGDVIDARLADGLRCQLLVAEPARFGWAMIRATGSAAHVELLRRRAGSLDLDTLVAPDEADVYRALDLPWITPEVRDGTDELATDFSDLVTLADITTAFHCHTTYSDGNASVEAMANAAHELGMRAITITDHSAAAAYAGGLDADRLRAQHAEIAQLAPPVKILRGTEADILADGAIDVPAELVAELDLVIASVHQRFKLDEAGSTRRIVTMLRQPFFKIWGHPLGRMVMRREPIPLRVDEVLDTAVGSRVAFEINGDPHRLDMPPELAQRAAALGIPFVVSSDAHSTRGLTMVRWSVALARRARLRRSQVLNALPPDELAERIRPLN
ncbi:MAG TPA: PHP domain-containing protein [Kofleriaceae bacterium]|jgi:DNA polymerase (family 10)|nr:PHP domain-containing protein [Kofleriaceae bacterium]